MKNLDNECILYFGYTTILCIYLLIYLNNITCCAPTLNSALSYTLETKMKINEIMSLFSVQSKHQTEYGQKDTRKLGREMSKSFQVDTTGLPDLLVLIQTFKEKQI